MTHAPSPDTLLTGRLPQAASLGATYMGNGRCQFNIWAPNIGRIEVRIFKSSDASQERSVPMEPGEKGYYHALVEGVEPGDRYMYRLDGEKERPDPASRFQPEGVHKPSQIVDLNFAWEDSSWAGIPLQSYIVYELHVGTFTPEGTFRAIIPYLDYLKELGITAIELLPVAQFPGSRNWGYDGVYPFAVQESYGGPTELKHLVNACHQRGLAVIMDVVYNHFGPEGNYLWDYAPIFFTDRYHTPWGSAVNFDGAHSDEVRRYFLENVLYWVSEFHMDALRLDAVHAIMDFSARTFLEEVGELVHQQANHLNRYIYTIAESDLNDTRIIRPREAGGFNLDTQWSDDFHHALHALLTGETAGYYSDFGQLQHLSKAFSDGYVYSGQYSEHRQRRHGNSARAMDASKFVVCIQNHDQVGNRMLGDRLGHLVDFERQKLAAGCVLLSPFLPMLFMGEEYGETAPFQYFVSHSDPGLVEAVQQGRKAEFAAFEWQGDVPDPQSEETFNRSKLNHHLRQEGQHKILYDLHQELIRLRKTLPALVRLSKEQMEVLGFEQPMSLFIRRWHGEHEVFLIFNFGSSQAALTLPVPAGKWQKVLASADARWQPAPDSASTSVLPDHVLSAGECALTLEPQTFALFERIA
jgi:maltooligosyltrehalose trehalohydrolase